MKIRFKDYSGETVTVETPITQDDDGAYPDVLQYRGAHWIYSGPRERGTVIEYREASCASVSDENPDSKLLEHHNL